MLTALQSLKIKGSAGNPLPEVYKSLTMKDTRFLRGQLALICAGPGCGKSAFALNLAMKSRVPTLYFSADSDPYTQSSRMISIRTETPLYESGRMVLDRNIPSEIENQIDMPIRFEYSASPTIDDIDLSMQAYAEVYEAYPALVIIDNITNVRSGGENEDNPYAGLEVLMEYLHDLARTTGSAVVGLHHVTGSFNDSEKPIPLSGIKGQIGRVPELILTMHKISDGRGSDSLRVSTVKNRAGRADPSGYDYAEMEFHGPTMTIKDA
jgi:replicative DNA helicase